MRSEILLLFVLCCVDVQSRRSFVIHLEKVECTANPSFINLTECSVREVNSVPTIFLDAVLLQDVNKFTFGMKVVVPREQGDLEMFSVKRMDGCVFLANTSDFPLVKIIRNELQRYSNLPTKCPVKAGTSVYIRGLKVDPDNFPTYAPETKFSSIGYMLTDTVSIFNMTVSGTCEARRKFFNFTFF